MQSVWQSSACKRMGAAQLRCALRARRLQRPAHALHSIIQVGGACAYAGLPPACRCGALVPRQSGVRCARLLLPRARLALAGAHLRPMPRTQRVCTILLRPL